MGCAVAGAWVELQEMMLVIASPAGGFVSPKLFCSVGITTQGRSDISMTAAPYRTCVARVPAPALVQHFCADLTCSECTVIVSQRCAASVETCEAAPICVLPKIKRGLSLLRACTE